MAEEFLSRFRVGAGVPKSMASTTHHNGQKTYYSIPLPEFSKVFNFTVTHHLAGAPLTLNEHADPNHTRLFLDLDCNKDGSSEFTTDHLFAMLPLLQREVRKTFDRDPLHIIPQLRETGTVFSWVNISRELLHHVDYHLLNVQSRPVSETKFRFHLVWPFILTKLSHAKKFFTNFFQSQAPALQERALPDLNLYSTGSLRGMFQAKTLEDRTVYTPFADVDSMGQRLDSQFIRDNYLGHIAGLSGQEGLVEFNLSHVKATSLLYGREWAAPVVTLPPAPEVDVTRIHFLTDREEINFVALRTLLLDALGAATEGTDLNELVLNTALPYLNKYICVLTGMSKSVYIVKQWCPAPQDLYPTFVFKDKANMEAFMQPSVVMFKAEWQKKSKKYDTFLLWCQSPHQLSFRRMELGDPEILAPDCFNLWRGARIPQELAVSYRDHTVHGDMYPAKVYSIQTILDHIFTFFCRSNELYYRYLIRWLAHIVQRPFVRTQISIILQSQEGVGKDLILSQVMTSILGRAHCLATPRPDDVSGRFNVGLEGKVLLIFDEASKLDEYQCSILKALITEPDLRLERKGFDAYTQPNFLNIIITTNDLSNNILTVGPQARRFFMLECLSTINQDKDYFTDLVKFFGIGTREEAGIRAFASLLYSVDLTNFKPRHVPTTEALVVQKLSKLPPVHEWWFDCLTTWCLQGTQDAQNGIPIANWSTAPVTLGKTDLYNAFVDWAKGRRTFINNNSHFWRLLKQVVEVTFSRPGDGPGRQAIAHVPDLYTCRLGFSTTYQGTSFSDRLQHGNFITHFSSAVVEIAQAPSLTEPVVAPAAPSANAIVGMDD
jgi:hypothetical protein